MVKAVWARIAPGLAEADGGFVWISSLVPSGNSLLLKIAIEFVNLPNMVTSTSYVSLPEGNIVMMMMMRR